jgi:hypothetical protein
MRMSGDLEDKLLSICGRIVPSPSLVVPRLEPIPHQRSHAETAGANILVNDPSLDSGGTTQSETTTVAVGPIVCSAWNDAGEGFGLNGFSGFGVSLDGGKTFKDNGPFPAGPSDTNFGDPSLAYSVRDNVFYYAALSSQGLSLWRSVTNCQTFEYVGVIHAGSGDDKELITVDNSPTSPHFGRIYIGWTDFGNNGDDDDDGDAVDGGGDAAPPPPPPATSSDLNTSAHSDDGGKTWTAAIHLPGSGGNGQGAFPIVAPNGDVYIALVNRAFTTGGLQDQFLFKSTDGGDTWVQMPNIATGQLQPENPANTSSCGRQALTGNIRNLSSPQIAVSASAAAPAGYILHAVYPYDSDGSGPDNSNVFYRRSLDGGQTWSGEIKINDDATSTDQFVPAVAVDETGVIFASWYDRRLDPTNNLLFDRFASHSADGGLTWSANERISDTSSPVAQTNPNFDGLATCYHGDYDLIAAKAGIGHIVWSDDRRITSTGPNPDVYYGQSISNTSAGRLSTAAAATSCNASVAFTLSDSDLKGAGTQAISIATSGGDTETLSLVEQAATPGVFTGSIATAGAPVVAGDGIVQVQDGATITATYNDANTGNGTPAVVTAQVKVDCAGPAISNVHTLSITGADAVVGIAASEPASLLVKYGLACGSLTQSAVSSGLSLAPTAKLTGLATSNTYFYAVTATDAVGNATTDDNGGNCYSLRTPDVLYQETFENGIGGFTIDNNFGLGHGLWHLSQGTCQSTVSGHSSPNTLYYGQDGVCNYANGFANEGVATSPIITIPDTTSVALELNYFLGTEGGGFFDKASVEVSINGAAFTPAPTNFTNLFASRFHRVRPDAEPAGTDALLENTGLWQHVKSDLTPLFAGSGSGQLQIRVHFNTVDSIANNFAGFFVDDITVTGKTKTCATDADCDDNVFCNGAEKCTDGKCLNGPAPNCDDSIACTTDACVESSKSCTHTANNAACDDGQFCDGVETCNAATGCVAGTPPCTNVCDETNDKCVQCLTDAQCSDGLFCNGAETCVGNVCVAGTPPCNDGVACTADTCNEATDTCQFTPNDAFCDDGLFCDGAEKCTASGCTAGTPPCAAGATCNEQTDTCCTPETDTAFCSRLGKNCGTVTAPDNCGVARTVTSCGTCTAPATCGGAGTANVCGGGDVDRTEGGTVTATGTACNTTAETPVMAYDNLTSTKWCVTSAPSTGTPISTMYDFAGTTAFAINKYTVTTANDVPTRDPRDWTLQGCQGTCTVGSGTGWVTLDTQTGQFANAARFQTNTYTFANTTAFQQYRLRITANNGATTRLQLAEIQLFGPAGCSAETNAQFCSRLAKNCGTVTAADNCGTTRTVTSCGTCTAPATCGGGGTTNVCGTAGSNCSAPAFSSTATYSSGAVVTADCQVSTTGTVCFNNVGALYAWRCDFPTFCNLRPGSNQSGWWSAWTNIQRCN